MPKALILDFDSTADESDKRKTYSVPAVQRALDIIEYLVTHGGPRNITEVSRQLSIPKSSVFGILQTLRDNGWVEKLDDDRYALTLKLFGLGSSIIASLDLRQQVSPVLRELANQTNITGHLAVLASDEAVYIDKAEVPGAIRLTTYVGSRCPLHSTGMGKALLAWLPDGEVERIIRTRGLTAYTPHTISSPVALRAEFGACQEGRLRCQPRRERAWSLRHRRTSVRSFRPCSGGGEPGRHDFANQETRRPFAGRGGGAGSRRNVAAPRI